MLFKGGYGGKILRVDFTKSRISEMPLDKVLEGSFQTFQYGLVLNSRKIVGFQAIGEFKDAWIFFRSFQQGEDLAKIKSILKGRERLKFHPWYFRLTPHLLSSGMA